MSERPSRAAPDRPAPRLKLPRRPGVPERLGAVRRSRRAPRARPSLASLGDLIVDIVVAPERPPERGTDTPGTIAFRVGGSAANTARAFARLGGRALFVGAVGADAWGRRLAAALRAERVVVRVAITPEPTARLLALIEADGERTFVTDRGAADRLAPADVDARSFRRVGALHIPAYSLLAEPLASAARRAAALAQGAGALVSVDLASHGPLLARGRGEARALLQGVAPDVLFATTAEAVALAGRGGPAGLLGVAPTLVLKEGSSGCRILSRSGGGGPTELAIATTPLRVRDSTGAGDAFDAGFLFSLLGEPDPALALQSAPALRRAALAGHRSAAQLLSEPRTELVP